MGSRSDKKEQTKPFVSTVVKEIVEDIRRFIKSSSNGETARRIVLSSFSDWTVIQKLQPFLRWDFTRGDHVFVGHSNHDEITSLLPDQWSRKERLPIRFTQDDMKQMELLRTCLSCPFAHMTGALLKLGVENHNVIQSVAPGYEFRSIHSLRRGVWR